MRVHGNVALSLDGRMAGPGGARVRLSGPKDRARVHRLRHDLDAILVGSGTVLADDPELLVDPGHAKVAEARHPLRVVLDGRLRTPPGARVLKGPAETVVFTARARRRELPGAEVVAAGQDRVALEDVLAALEARGCRSVLVEGGARVHASFVTEGLYDTFTAYVAPVRLGDGPGLGDGFPAAAAAEAPPLRFVSAQPLGEGTLLEYARP